VNLDLHYQSNGFYDEMLAAEGRPRPAYRRLYEQLNRLGRDELQRRHALAMEMFRNHGITFGVYPDAQGTEAETSLPSPLRAAEPARQG